MASFTRESAVRVGHATLWVERNRVVPGGRIGRRGLPAGASQVWIGKLDEQLVYEGSATVSVWTADDLTGSVVFTDSTVNVEAYDWLLSSGQTIESGIKVVLGFVGVWIVIGAQCP